MLNIIKGNIIYTKEKDSFEVIEDGFLVAEDDIIIDVFPSVDALSSVVGLMDLDHLIDGQTIEGIMYRDYKDAVVIPSFIDLHVHAPQYMQMGIGLNLELIDWLNQYTFMLEGRFADVNYAKKVYPYFVEDLYQHGTLRAVIYGTIHNEANMVLVEELVKRGLKAYVGKVNMNRHAPVSLVQTTERSVRETEEFIEALAEYKHIKPIITPRFAPSCSQELLLALGDLADKYHLPVQSHLAENKGEIGWVKDLFPTSKHYSDVYDMTGLYISERTLMAHGIYLNEDEITLALEKSIYLVHCPSSNMNLTSGIMPLTSYLDQGMLIGLGSDVGAGHTLSMNNAITSAIQCSKIRHVSSEKERILKESEAFYLATKSNGRFFGKVGSFEPGYQLDALIIKDPHPVMEALAPMEQLQRFLYCGGPDSILDRYLGGIRL